MRANQQKNLTTNQPAMEPVENFVNNFFDPPQPSAEPIPGELVGRFLARQCEEARQRHQEVLRAREPFGPSRKSPKIFRDVSNVSDILGYKTDEQFEELCEKTAWKFDEKMKKQAASYDVFKASVHDPSILDECGLDEETKETLLTHIKRRLMSQAVKVRADIEVGCCVYEGIDAVKDALRKGIALSTEDMQIKINLIAPPLYVVTTTTLDKEKGIDKLNEALKDIETSIKAAGGIFSIQHAPKVVTDIDESELAKRLDQLERENAEVDGDEDNSDE